MSTCLVTGGATGVGLETAKQLATIHDEVVICGRRAEKLQDAKVEILSAADVKATVHAVTADVSRVAEVTRVFDYMASHCHDPLMVCVNNAGVLHKASVVDMTEAMWDEQIACNLKASFLCAQAAFATMQRHQGGGCIVNVSSLAGIAGMEKFPGMSAYVAAKHGVVGLTEALAVEGRPLGIRVNCVAPGAVDTEMLKIAGIDCQDKLYPREVAHVIVSYCDVTSSADKTGHVEIVTTDNR